MKILSVRENPQMKDRAIAYFCKAWARGDLEKGLRQVYKDSIITCITAKSPLPEFYLLTNGDKIIGCVNLVTNDFISRMDLYPWLGGLFIEKDYRGNNLSKILIDKVKKEAKRKGFAALYLSTDHIGLYEKHEFTCIGQGYHPWGDSSRIYKFAL